jgi:ABC-type antimicrobial peptide transport system permease subunit
LFVVGVSLALAAAETRDERDVLAVVGAAPAVMRRTSAQKAAILTVMSALLAVPVGFLPAIVFTAADGRDSPWLVFPWRTVLLLLIAVPLVTAAATSITSTLALRVRPVRVSTMTFE